VFGALGMLMGMDIGISLVIGIGAGLLAKEIIARYFPPSTTNDCNDDVAFEELSKAPTKLRNIRTSLALLHSSLSKDYPLPPPDTAELRTAWFLKRAKEEGKDLSKITRRIRIIEKPEDFGPFAEKYLHFIIVKLPDNVIAMQSGNDNKEIRVAREDVDHDLLVLEDETKFCEGSLIFIARKDPVTLKYSYTFLIYGNYRELKNKPPTTNSSVDGSFESIAQFFRDTLQEKSAATNITINESPEHFNSAAWKLIR
jgi:hypothetical protein